MLFFDGAFGLVMLALWIFCIIDVIMTPAEACRNLPKMAWLLLVLILPDVGSIVWLVAGHPWAPAAARPSPTAGRFPEYDRPGRAVASNPDDDEAFLRRLRERAEEQRRRAQGDAPPPDDLT